ncbi:hypothetical protein H8356DRAFT_1430411 [Neocallimastix lanati (nom. inval.)]|nr:hypothetical protein H8356DRAFT_1430411 [Neocallimastix sp. JGI-2020a]
MRRRMEDHLITYGFRRLYIYAVVNKYNTTITIRVGRVSEDCPETCPCCDKDNQSFEHWIFKCNALASFRWNSLNFIDESRCFLFRQLNELLFKSTESNISHSSDSTKEKQTLSKKVIRSFIGLKIDKFREHPKNTQYHYPKDLESTKVYTNCAILPSRHGNFKAVTILWYAFA